MTKRDKDSKNDGATTVNITGGNNIVQAGIYGTASIMLDLEARDALSEALAKIRSDIAKAVDLAPETVRELQVVVDECDAEVQKPTPNRMRIVGCLHAIATTIQTTAALGDAWTMVKKACTLMGIPNLNRSIEQGHSLREWPLR